MTGKRTMTEILNSQEKEVIRGAMEQLFAEHEKDIWDIRWEDGKWVLTYHNGSNVDEIFAKNLNSLREKFLPLVS